MNRTFWILREAGTDRYLPEVVKRVDKRGYTFTQPTTNGPPRLFATSQGATSARTWWLKKNEGELQVCPVTIMWGSYAGD